MSREEAMRRHPSYRARVAGLVSEARREQADDVARRMLVEAEGYSGGPVVPESPEVRWQRETDEACALASSNAAPRPEPESPVVAAVKAFGAGMAVFGTIWVMGLAGQFAGGWPL